MEVLTMYTAQLIHKGDIIFEKMYTNDNNVLSMVVMMIQSASSSNLSYRRMMAKKEVVINILDGDTLIHQVNMKSLRDE